MTRATVVDATPRDLLHHDHEDLEVLLDELLSAAEADVDTCTLHDVWGRVEDRVRDHLAAEEEELFPRFEQAHPQVIERLRREHAAIRDLLLTIGVEVDLHLVRAPTVRAAVDLLRAHAAYEDETMYRWAAEDLSPPARRSLLDRLADRLVA